MRYIPFNLLEEIPGNEDKFWTLISSDHGFYKMTRAYNTINELLYEAEKEGIEAVFFRTDDLRKERLWLKDQIFFRLRH